MGKKNKLTKSKNSWTLSEWQTKCPELTYVKLENEPFPNFIPSSLSDKYNSGFFASSGSCYHQGSEEIDVYIAMFMGMRVDEPYIDEQPYIAGYDKKSNKLIFDGYLQHGDWTGRTTPLTAAQLNAISSSGITTNISLSRIPEQPSGSLDDLSKAGILNGFTKTAGILMNKIKNEKD